VASLVQIHAPASSLPFAPVEGPLIDTFGRAHTDFRISVIDRCNIRCFYCMPEEGGQFVPNSGLLSYPEIVRIARVAVQLGIRKIRLTGGEPLLRRGLPTLIERLASLPLSDLALTTNGVLLADHVQALRDAGLRRLNIHLDTLDRQRFFQITRRDDLPRVLAGIDAASGAGLEVKLNAVAVHNLNEPDLIPLTRFARERALELRFIEFMPLDGQGLWRESDVLTAGEMIARISEEFGPLTPVPDADPRAPATEYRFADGAKIGFIASVSRPFCHNCNRVRLTSDGKLRYCLFAREETDLRPALAESSDKALETLFRRTVWEKWAGHDIGSPAFESPQRPMYSIGG
jgi:cyclic pyranopterin phosphate synthase